MYALDGENRSIANYVRSKYRAILRVSWKITERVSRKNTTPGNVNVTKEERKRIDSQLFKKRDRERRKTVKERASLSRGGREKEKERSNDCRKKRGASLACWLAGWLARLACSLAY